MNPCVYPKGCGREARGPGHYRPRLCALHALRYDDGRGKCQIRGCAHVRYGRGDFCEQHVKARLTYREQRILTRIGEGEDPVAAVAAETGLTPVKAEQALEKMSTRPGFREGLEAILADRGVDPSDGVVAMWQTLVEGCRATKTALVDGEPVDVGPDWTNRLNAAGMIAKVGPGFASTKSEVREERDTVVIHTHARQPLPLEAEIVDAPEDDE